MSSSSSPTEVDARVAALCRHYESVYREKMQGLPFVNPALAIEAVGFRPAGEHVLGVLIAPWFINLVLLPGNDKLAALAPGESFGLLLGGETIEFTATAEAATGPFLTAVLFRSVEDFDDQSTARAVSLEVMRLLREGEAGSGQKAGGMSRRDLFRAAG